MLFLAAEIIEILEFLQLKGPVAQKRAVSQKFFFCEVAINGVKNTLEP